MIILKKKNIVFGAYIFIINNLFLQGAGLLLLGFGWSTNELGITGSEFGPLIIFAGLFLLISLSAAMAATTNKSTIEVKNPDRAHFLIFLYFGVLLALYSLPVFYYGSVFTLGIDRYQYYLKPLVSGTGPIRDFLGLLLIPAVALAKTQKQKQTNYILVVLFILLLLARGEKFSGFYLILLFSTIGFVISNDFKANIIIKFSIALISLTAFVAIYYVVTREDIDLSLSIYAVALRVVKQGQLGYFFITNHIYDFELANFIRSFNYFGSKTFSMNGMMDVAMPPDQRMAHSGGLAGGFPAVIFFMGGGIFVSVIVALGIMSVVAFIFESFFKVLNIFDGFLSFLLIPFYIYPLRSLYKLLGGGDLFLVTSPYFGLCIFIILISRVLWSSVSDYGR